MGDGGRALKWYKHDANANADAKLRKFRIKYGMEGYGLYWYCLELIAQNVEKHNLSFELEHDAEIIAHDTGIHFERVQEMMAYMVDLSLFEQSEGRITCLKMASRTDEYTQKLIKSSGVVPTPSRHPPDNIRLNRIEENRTEENRKRGGKKFAPPTLQEVLDYRIERSSPVDPARFVDFYQSKNWMVGKNKMKDWKAAFRNWEKRENENSDKRNRQSAVVSETYDYAQATDF